MGTLKYILRIFWWVLGVGIVAALFAAAFWPQTMEVETSVVSRGPLEELVREDGMTRVRERYTVSSPVAGRLLRINLEPGDPIASGQTILATVEPVDPAMLDSRQRAEAEARVAAAQSAMHRTEAAIEKAQVELVRAESKLKRAAELVAANAIAKEEYEESEADSHSKRESVRMAKYDQEISSFELEQAQLAVARFQPGGSDRAQPTFEIRTPVPGVVLKVLQESSTVVGPGTPLMEIGDPGDLEIVVDVLSTDAVKIRPGATMRLEQWGGDQPLTGVVRRVEPSAFTKISALGVEEQRVFVVGDFSDVANASALGDGYRVEAGIVTWNDPDVMQVPSGALFRDKKQWAVFCAVDGVAVLRHVEAGHRSETMVEVTGGLATGERVIMYPGDLLTDGARIVDKNAPE